MNKLINIRDNYNLTNKDLASLFKVHPNTIGNMLDKEITDLPLNYIILLHQYKNIPYNMLLGENIFTLGNIGTIARPYKSKTNEALPIVLIDEPESSLHPADIRVIQKLIEQRMKKK